MMFLLRMTFWLGLVLVLLPVGGSKDSPKANVSATDAVTAALGTVSDLREFCARQPSACVFGSQAAAAIGARAQANAKVLYEFMTDRMTAKDTAPASTGSATGKAADVPLPAARPTNDTLSSTDLRPHWRGPAETRHAYHAKHSDAER